MRFTIVLKNGYAHEFKREEFLKYFPESMIGLALNDPEAEVIEIPNSCITPEILKILSHIVSTGCIPPYSPIDMKEAARYLLIDLLEVIGDPKYRLFRLAHPEINLLDMEKDADAALYYSIREGYTSLGVYILAHSLYTEGRWSDHLMKAVLANRPILVDRLIKAGVNPFTAKLNGDITPYDSNLDDIMSEHNTNQALGTACYLGYEEIVSILLKDSRIQLSYVDFGDVNPLRYALRENHLSICDMLIHDRRYDLEGQDLSQLYNECHHASVMRYLLSLERIDVECLNFIIRHGHNIEVACVLLEDPRTNPLAGRCSGIILAIVGNRRSTLEKLYTDSRLTPPVREAVERALEGHINLASKMIKDLPQDVLPWM